MGEARSSGQLLVRIRGRSIALTHPAHFDEMLAAREAENYGVVNELAAAGASFDGRVSRRSSLRGITLSR